MRKVLLLLVFSALIGSGSAFAQSQRPLPQNAKRGVIGQPLPLPMIEIDGVSMRMGPAAIIYDNNNRTIVHAQLPPSAPVLYTVDAAGNVQRIYILTPIEQARLDQAPQ